MPNPRGYAIGGLIALLCLMSIFLGRGFSVLILLFVLAFALPMLLTHLFKMAQAWRSGQNVPLHLLAASGLSTLSACIGLAAWYVLR